MSLSSTEKERPDANDVAVRVVVLRHVIGYGHTLPDPMGFADAMAGWTDDEKREIENRSRLARDEYWSTLGEFAEYLSPKEKEFSRMSIENYDPHKIINMSWRLEALGMLLWSLGYVDEIPPYDTQLGVEDVDRFIKTDPEEFFGSARLRPQNEIDKAREEAEAWHWRSRTRQIIEEGTPFPDDPNLKAAGFSSFDDIVRNASQINTRSGTFTAIDEDWPTFGKAYRDLTMDEWSWVQSITAERHFALNWLCGYSPGHRWDDTPTDT